VGEKTLTLEDFVTAEKIATRGAVCPLGNTGMVGALKNLQMVLHNVFSDAFEDCLEAFTDNLEGIYQPMVFVSADFLKHMVEITIRRVFRVVVAIRFLSVRTFTCLSVFSRRFQTLDPSVPSHCISCHIRYIIS
jgi:hypothetical protein